MARVGLDIDGVLFDFTGRFREWVQGELQRHMPEPTTWKFYREWGWNEAGFSEAHWEFVKADQYEFGRLIGGAETRMAIKKLRDLGHEIILVTARHTTPEQHYEIERQTKAWLAFQDITYDELHFERDKTKIDLDYFLDDRYENYDALGDTFKVNSFLLDQPWNREQRESYDDECVVSSVEEYVNIVLEEVEQKSDFGISEDGHLWGNWTEVGHVDETEVKPPLDLGSGRLWMAAVDGNGNAGELQDITDLITDVPFLDDAGPVEWSLDFNVEDIDPEVMKMFYGSTYNESVNVSNENADLWSNEREDVLARFAHELSKATGDGSKKRQSGEKPPWYLDKSHEGAIFSHITKWKRGEKVDPDSGAHPLVHAAWRCLAIAASESGNTPDPMNKELA